MNSALIQDLAPLPVAVPAPDTDTPVFIVGPGRSGTTLLSRILDQHSELAIFPETWMYVILDQLGCLETFSHQPQYSLFLNRVWKSVASHDAVAARAVADEALARPVYTGPARDILRSIGERYARLRQTRFWGEKTPGHVLWLPQIRQTFPRARVLMMIRDPRDVIVSYCERWNKGSFDANYVLRTAALVRHYLRHCLLPPFPQDQVRWVRYEKLTSDPRGVIAETCSFLGMPFEPGMLEYYRDYDEKQATSADGNHHRLLAEPVTGRRVGRFRHVFSPSLLKLVEEFLGEELEQVGYAREADRNAAVSDEEASARQLAIRAYRDMAAGKIRRRLRRKSQARIWVLRALGSALQQLPFVDLALTPEQWASRLSQVPLPPSRKPQPAKKPSESLGVEPGETRNLGAGSN